MVKKIMRTFVAWHDFKSIYWVVGRQHHRCVIIRHVKCWTLETIFL